MKSYVVDKKNFATWEELAYDMPCLNSVWSSQLNETKPAHCLLPAEEEKFSLQSGASSLAKHGGAYFSAICGSIQDPISAPGPCENQEF